MIDRMLAACAVAAMLAGCGNGSTGAGADVPMVRDAQAGTPYGSAGPRTCPDRKIPAEGPVDTAQAAAYVICGIEKEAANTLTLVGEITVAETSPGRPYDPRQDNNVPDIDVERPLQSIRGSLVVYVCNRVDTGPGWGPRYERGTNCSITEHPDARGLCYQDGMGQWDCKLSDFNARTGVREGLPPPA